MVGYIWCTDSSYKLLSMMIFMSSLTCSQAYNDVCNPSPIFIRLCYYHIVGKLSKEKFGEYTLFKHFFGEFIDQPKGY